MCGLSAHFTPAMPFSLFRFSSKNFVFSSILFVLISTGTALAQTNKNSHDKKAAKPYTVFVAGDIADCRKTEAADSAAEKTAKLIDAGITQDKNALVITLGDNTYPIGKPEEFSNCYDKTWGRFKDRTLPSPGNHDYGVPLAQGYYNYFDELAGPDRRGYYKKIVGSWQFISLNSNIEGDAMRQQMLWLKNELQNERRDNKRLCTIAFWHHPAFSSGGHGNNEVMLEAWKVLADAKADLVLVSHDHDYERFVPLDADGNRDDKAGIRSFVVGTGGAGLTPMFLPRNTTEIRNNESHGVLKLTLYQNAYDWEFLPVAGQTFSDKGHGVCH
jgi:hypothetical protein